MPRTSKYHKKVSILEENLLLSELISYLNQSNNNHFELGLVLNKEEKLVGVIEAKRGCPLLKMLISKPRDAHRGI